MILTTILSAITGLFGSSSAGWLKWASLGVGVLAVAAVVVWLGWSRANLRADLAQSEANLAAVQTAYDASRAAMATLQAVMAARAEALAERDNEISKINAQSRVWQRKWQEAIRNEPETRDWADTALPESVRSLLQ